MGLRSMRAQTAGSRTAIARERRTPGSFAEAAEGVLKAGYDALKFTPFGTRPTWLDRAAMDAAVERVRAVRETVVPGVDLLIDQHK